MGFLPIKKYLLEGLLDSNAYIVRKTAVVCGIDEVGRGPWAGPLVACALILKKDSPIRGCRDSKKLSAKQREKIYAKLQKLAHYGVGVSSVEEVDQLGLIRATNLAFERALKELVAGRTPRVTQTFAQDKNRNRAGKKALSKKSRPVDGVAPVPDFLLVDGRDKLALPYPHKTIVKGDVKIKLIACASIVAKVTRDKMMRDLAQKYPQYGFERHKGYGTAEHRLAIRRHGICAIHRKSFAPIKLFKQAK